MKKTSKYIIHYVITCNIDAHQSASKTSGQDALGEVSATLRYVQIIEISFYVYYTSILEMTGKGGSWNDVTHVWQAILSYS